MTAADQLSGLYAHDMDFTVLFDGVGTLFGTQAGIIRGTSGITNPPPTLTSIEGVKDDSVKFGKQVLNEAAGSVKPTSIMFAIRMSDVGDPVDWDAYFNVEADPATYLLADLTDTGTVLSVSSNAGFAINDVIYCHGETMVITGTGSGTLIVTRQYCTLPLSAQTQVHTAGSIIRKQPRHWLGRWVEVKVWLGESDVQETIYMQMSAPPVRDADKNEWRFQLDDVMRTLDRDIAVGINGSDVAGIQNAWTGGEPNIQLTPAITREFQNFTGNRKGSLILSDANGNWAASYIRDFTGTSPVTDYSNFYNVGGDYQNITKMIRCYTLNTSPMEAMLQVLLSNRGTLTNHGTYDVLFGITSYGGGTDGKLGQGEQEVRFGANLPPGLIDIATLESFIDQRSPGWNYVLGASGSVKLLEFMEDVAYALGIYWCVDASGRLTCKRLAGTNGATTAPDYTLTEDDITPDSPKISVYDEGQIAAQFRIKCNFDPSRKTFNGTMISIFEQEAQTYQALALASKAVETTRKGLLVALNGAVLSQITGGLGATAAPEASVRVGMDRTQARRMIGLARYQIIAPWRFSNVKPGMIIRLTEPFLIDFAGNTLSASSMEVLETQRTEKGDISISIRPVWVGVLVAPTATIDNGWIGGSHTLPLQSGTRWTPTGFSTTPTDFFASGWKVRVHRKASTPPFSQHEDFTVTGVPSGSTLTISGTPSWGAPVIGDLLVLQDYDNANSAALNVAQSLGQHDYAFQANNNFQLGATPDPAQKWG